MRKQLENQLADLEKAHEGNRKEYHDLLNQKKDIEGRLRAANVKASESHNGIAALKAALDKLPAEPQ